MVSHCHLALWTPLDTGDRGTGAAGGDHVELKVVEALVPCREVAGGEGLLDFNSERERPGKGVLEDG